MIVNLGLVSVAGRHVLAAFQGSNAFDTPHNAAHRFKPTWNLVIMTG